MRVETVWSLVLADAGLAPASPAAELSTLAPNQVQRVVMSRALLK